MGKNVATTATTGSAAVNLGIKGATTTHSFMGAGLCEGTFEECVLKIAFDPKAKKRWQQVNTLIIEEVSQFSARNLDNVWGFADYFRFNKNNPTTHFSFCGLQIILIGDPLQVRSLFTNSLARTDNQTRDTTTQVGSTRTCRLTN